METPFKLGIYTPERTIFENDVVSLIAPGECGYFGVLAHHAPFVSSLFPGKISVRDETGKSIVFHSSGKGFFEVSNNKVVLLIDAVRE